MTGACCRLGSGEDSGFILLPACPPLLSKPHFSDPSSQPLLGCFFPRVSCSRTWLGLARDSHLCGTLPRGLPCERTFPLRSGSGPRPHPGLVRSLHLPL